MAGDCHMVGIAVDERLWEFGKAVAAILGSWEFLRYVYRWIFRRRSRLERKVERLEEEAKWKDEEIRDLRAKGADLDANLAAAKKRLPELVIEQADKEWRDNNQMRAIRELQNWFDANSNNISTIAACLARFHISRAVPTPGDHLEQARNMLRLARGASPDDRDLRRLSRELDLVSNELQERLIRDGDSQLAWNGDMAPRLGASGEAHRPLATALCDIAKHYHSKGHLLVASIFADRAAEVAQTGGRPLIRLWLSIEAIAGYFKFQAGDYHSAIDRLKTAAALASADLPAEDEVVLAARFYLAHALRVIGAHEEALVEVDSLLSTFTKIKGARKPYILMLRMGRADLLNILGESVKALVEIEELLELQIEEFGEHHREVLTTRYYWISILDDLHRYSEALIEIDALLPIHAEVKGERHPDVIESGRLRASILQMLGRHADALEQVNIIIPTAIEVLGTKHPRVLTYKRLRVELLYIIGRSEEALQESEMILRDTCESGLPATDILKLHEFRFRFLRNTNRYEEILKEYEPVKHLVTNLLPASNILAISTHVFYAHALFGVGRYEEAAAILAEFGPILAEKLGGLNVEVVANRMVHVLALKQLGRDNEARDEALDVAALLNPQTDPSGSLRSTLAEFLSTDRVAS
jgi:tetratricopeptide (TPR) repeat protein